MSSYLRWWVIAALVANPLLAAAQPAPPPAAVAADPNVETARRYFEAGVAAMQREDWPEAVNGFSNSQRLRRTASVSLNLGVALHRLGRLVEARVELQDFTQNATPAQHAQHDAEVGRLLSEIGRRLGRIQIGELRPTAATVTVDGAPAVLNDERVINVNPGDHRVRAEAEGFAPHEETVRVPEAGLRSVRLVLVANAAVVVAAPAVRPPPSEPPPSRSIVTRWWFWTGIGVVVAGAAVGVGVALSGTNDPPASTTGVVLQGVRVGGLSW